MISSNTYEEVYEVLSYMDKITVMKIPDMILKNIKDNRNIKYKTRINKNDIFNEQNLSKEAVDFLCWINYTYLIDNSKKNIIDKKILGINFMNNEEKRNLYNPQELFKNKQKIVKEQNSSKTLITKHKEENLIQKILNKIKCLFKKN